ncbi:hypothetical protein SLEP1_g5452 [Rubroshorea leprosula]|uniref:Uncharacterized protein n=1 Tax=Rubroshorea leprosula TaxID=152421 RepID=A0AAV5I1T4_9ROSI|nr:hypothetical protein SLEP1_g5452 [Rubroshorea leprosula]
MDAKQDGFLISSFNTRITEVEELITASNTDEQRRRFFGS